MRPPAPPAAAPPGVLIPLWEYASTANDATLVTRTTRLVLDLRSKAALSWQIATDSRPFHRKLFSGMTPPGLNRLAGQYRGESPEPLLSARSFVGGEEKTPPRFVIQAMVTLRANVEKKFAEFDKKAEKKTSPDAFLLEVVEFGAAVFCDFLAIHPYVNGNGHIARLMLTGILGRYGYWLKRWSVHPRPGEPYLGVQYDYWRGSKQPLHEEILKDLL